MSHDNHLLSGVSKRVALNFGKHLENCKFHPLSRGEKSLKIGGHLVKLLPIFNTIFFVHTVDLEYK